MVVVVGLACGMGWWAMAFVTAFAWVLVYCLIRTRAAGSDSTRRRRGTEASVWHGAIAARVPQVSAAKFRAL